MNTRTHAGLTLAVGLGLFGALATAQAQPFNWKTVANNGNTMPGSTSLFNSYNQPSVNASGMVVFRARSKGSGGAGQPVRGIYERDMRVSGPLIRVTTTGSTVPQPNNTYYNGDLAQFNEFPAFPRIDALSPTIATRGQSQPVWTYLLADGTETRVGTSGVYANPGGTLMTGASLLGAVAYPNNALVFPWFQVPGAPPGTRFDQFPGAAAVTGGTTIAFKGNYTDPVTTLGMTGVYYKNVSASWGMTPIYLIANSNTRIPNQPAGGTVKFGATAPPSAAGGYMYFTAWDNEDAPTMGGIYRSPMTQPPALQTLVGIGSQVPGEAAGTVFNQFGEGLSVGSDGRYLAYWGTWGTETTQKTLTCPQDGEASVIAYCLQLYPSGSTTVNVPVHQGVFVIDTRNNTNTAIAKTGQYGLQDFLYWVFSGAPPAVGGGDEGESEPPRWRSSPFTAISGKFPYAVRVAYKANRLGASGSVDGIYMYRNKWAPFVTVAEIGSSGTAIDPHAPLGSKVSALGIERDGFREGYMSITASMLEPITSTGWAGVYAAYTPMTYCYSDWRNC